MVELISVPPQQKLGTKAKVPLDLLVGQVLDYLRDHPRGETVEDLAANIEVPAANIRKILGIIATVTSKVAPLFLDNPGAKVHLLLTRSPKGTITAVRFEVAPPGPVEADAGTEDYAEPESLPGQKPTYTMGPADVTEIQRVWKLYKATGRAFRHEEATRLNPLCEKFPYLFTLNAARTGILPTMALFTVARTLDEYASLGRLPDAIETPVAIITFEGRT